MMSNTIRPLKLKLFYDIIDVADFKDDIVV